VEAKNQADAVLHSSEKALAEHGDKIGADDKSAVENAIADLKGVLESGDPETISAKTQALIQASMKLGEAMYASQQQPEGGADDAQASGGDDVVDAEFEEVSGDDQKKSA
jgi:molecular chaperone DnaK